MIKLASIALLPALVATFYSHDNGSAVRAVPAQLREQDRSFLVSLSQQEQETALLNQIAAQRADAAFLLELQEEDLIPVRRAIPVDRSIPEDPWADAVREGHEVRRAIPVVAPAVVAGTSTDSSVSLASDTDRRSALQRSYVTLVEQGPEEHPAAPGKRNRPSISIYGDQIIIRTNAVSSR